MTSPIAITISIIILVPLVVVDIKRRILPDKLTLSMLGINLTISGYYGLTSFINSITGALVGGGFLLLSAIVSEKILKKETMGGGDIKLMAALGAALGPFLVFPLIFSASVSSLIYIAIRYPFTKKFMGESLPFGPFIAIGFVATILIEQMQ